MIYTITLNPSIDFVVRVKNIKFGHTNRAFEDKMYAGGKGIMVSKLLKNIGTVSIATGFIGGFTGEFILENLNKIGIKTDFVNLRDKSRINIKLKSKEETEINCIGPNITEDEIEAFYDKISSISETDFVVISGSIPVGLSETFYNDIMKILKEKKINFALDTSGLSFKYGLSYNPFFIKPNKAELEEYANKIFNNNDEIIKYVRDNVLDKVKHIIVTLGGDGALYINKDYSLYAYPVKGEIINTVGAGDSVVAGFIDYILKGYNEYDSFKFGVSCGTATAYSEDIATLELISKIKNKLIIERINYEN